MHMSTSNSKHGSFLFKNNENTYPEGKALMQILQNCPLNDKRGYVFFIKHTFTIAYIFEFHLYLGYNHHLLLNQVLIARLMEICVPEIV